MEINTLHSTASRQCRIMNVQQSRLRNFGGKTTRTEITALLHSSTTISLVRHLLRPTFLEPPLQVLDWIARHHRVHPLEYSHRYFLRLAIRFRHVSIVPSMELHLPLVKQLTSNAASGRLSFSYIQAASSWGIRSAFSFLPTIAIQASSTTYCIYY